MKVRRASHYLIYSGLLVTLLFVSCAQAPATPAPIAVQPARPPATYYQAPAPTQAYLQPVQVSPLTGAQAPTDNYFQDYGQNPYEDPLEDRLSTFGLDVDTASYTVARRYVNDGLIPPEDAVRVEEFVNYFDPGYPTPSNIAFGIYADGAPSPFQQDGMVIVRIGIQGYRIDEWARKPASLTFVIDVSGSMEQENRLELVKQSLKILVDHMTPADSVAIVTYGSQAQVVLEPTDGSNRKQIRAAIQRLRTGGSTNAEAGLQLGYQLAYQAYRPGATNRVILCSDGVANVGATGPEAILESIGGYADLGINLTTVGFGMGNFNDVLMEQLADRGNGNYAYVDQLDEAEKLFDEELTGTLQTIARDARVQVDFDPQVVARYRLIGYENRSIADQDFRNDTVDAGELGAGHHVTALYALYLKPGAGGHLASVHLRWAEPQTGHVQEIGGELNSWDLAACFECASPRYQLAVVVAQYAELLRNSPYAGSASIQDILNQSIRVAGLLSEDAEVAEFASLVSRASLIQALEQ